MQIDPSKSAMQNLLNLIDSASGNSAGPTNPNQVTYQNLQAATLEGDAAANTSVELVGVTDNGFTGNQTYYYGRLDPAAEVTSPTSHAVVPAGTTDAPTILGIVANHYGFIESEISWVSTPTKPSTMSSDPTTSTPVVQTSNSLIYLDGQANINLDWQASTVALLHFDGDVTDQRGHTATNVGSNTWASSNSGPIKFGTDALGIGSGGSCVELADPGDLTFLNNFTIESEVYLASHGGYLWAKNDGTNSCYAFMDSTTKNFNVKTDTASVVTVGNYGSIQNQYNHIALTKNGTTWTVWVNGVAIGTFTSSDSFGNISTFWTIGNMNNANNPVAANLDETRFSRVCRYTSAFTQPSAAFTLD